MTDAREAIQSLLWNAELLWQNSLGCAREHHGVDFEQQGMPGWLLEAQGAIERGREALAALAPPGEAVAIWDGYKEWREECERASPPPGEAGEPVAWRCYSREHGVEFCSTPSRRDMLAARDYEITPLYAHPAVPSPPQADSLREFIIDEIRNHYDKAPDLGRASYPAFEKEWDDGAEGVADRIIAREAEQRVQLENAEHERDELSADLIAARARIEELTREKREIADELFDVRKRYGCGPDDTGPDARARIEELTRERDEATTYLRNLLVSFVNQHCEPVPEWKPLEGDLIGMLTQFDNASTVAREFRARIAELERERDAAIQVSEMNATAGGFTARHLENANARIAKLERALEPFRKYARATRNLDGRNDGEPIPCNIYVSELKAVLAALRTDPQP